ncbi:hypothetical protein [uncultured Pseudoteredinibacter sp.]|uniref:hypothetical protein n=1 Tax=uncultured Pseudoteredinibacter sp. TaxID=1641701 RepID=UPI0026307C8B|nr:hypothetical protein [uncultured Pseudoteredinibacter sp.]
MNVYKYMLMLALLMGNGVVAQSSLESPGNNSIEGGVGLLRGWTCEDAKEVQVVIDDFEPIRMITGGARSDTSQVCKNEGNNGFGSIIFWGNYGLGEHQARLFIDGNLVSTHNFTIAGASAEFLTGVSRVAYVNDFPDAASKTLVQWSQANQNFVIRDVVEKKLTHNIGFLDKRDGFITVADYLVEEKEDGSRTINVNSIYGEILRIRACTQRRICSEGDSIFIDEKIGSDVVIDVSSVGDDRAYLLFEMLDENGDTVTPSIDVEFQAVYEPQ